MNAPEKNSPEKPTPKKGGNSDSLIDYLKLHIRETITYILLVLGIIMLFFDQLYGGILVGIIGGIYFGDEIVAYIKSWGTATSSKQVSRNLILGGVGVALFILAPAIFLGAAISVGVKHLFVTS